MKVDMLYCRFGGVEAATFCALWGLYDQMQNDKTINVYQTAKLYHLKRAQCVGSKVITRLYLFITWLISVLVQFSTTPLNWPPARPSKMQWQINTLHGYFSMSVETNHSMCCLIITNIVTHAIVESSEFASDILDELLNPVRLLAIYWMNCWTQWDY